MQFRIRKMGHHKGHHREHQRAIVVSPPESERFAGPFFRSWGVYFSRHWAWIAIIALWSLFRTRRNRSDAMSEAIIAATAVVVVLGWRQLATTPYLRGYFGVLLVFAGVMVFAVGFPVLFILLLIAVFALGIDLFFVAPHRRL